MASKIMSTIQVFDFKLKVATWGKTEPRPEIVRESFLLVVNLDTTSNILTTRKRSSTTKLKT